MSCMLIAALARAQPGRLDPSFDPGTGIATAEPSYRTVSAVAVQPDGRVVMGGTFTNVDGITRYRVARLETNGSLDVSFNPPEIYHVACPNCGGVQALAIQADGRILIGGVFNRIGSAVRNHVARLMANRALDETFDAGAGPNQTVAALAVQSDGRIVIAGHFTEVAGVPRNRIARLNTDGTLDQSFNPGTGADSLVLHLFSLSGNKVLLAGWLNRFNGVLRNKMARLNSDGSLDTGFVPAWEQNVGLDALGVTLDERAVAAGGRISRFNTNGAFDATFQNGQIATGGVSTLTVQADGKIIVAGPTSVSNLPAPRLLRLNADGSRDTNFVSGTGPDGVIRCMAIQPDGHIIIGGTFTNFNGVPRSGIARIFGGEPPPEAPAIVSHPTDQTVEAGQSVSFTVTATGWPTPNYQWLFNDDPLPGAIHPTLTLPNPRSTNAGAYSVVVSNENGVVQSDPATLTVLTFPPVITEHPLSQEVDASRSVYLTVTATGTGPFSYQWFHNDEPITNQTRSYLSRVITLDRAGTYKVQVSNEAGTAMSDPAVITVRVYPPTIDSGPTNLSLLEGQRASFRVFADGAPFPTYQWFFSEDLMPNETNSLLRINDVRLEDTGSYWVIVSNSEGSLTSAPATLVVAPAKTNAGSVDITFRPGAGASDAITRIALQSDGKILAGGYFTQFNGTNRSGCARLHTDGSLDASFTPSGFWPGEVQYLAEVADGKIFANRTLGPMVRWNSDGSLDPTFTAWTSPFGFNDVLGIQSDDRIVLASSGGSTPHTLWRLTSDGLSDFTFNMTSRPRSGGGVSDPPGCCQFRGTVLSDWRVLVMWVGGLLRLHPHGAPDFTFRAGLWPDSVDVFEPKKDGRIFVAGTFTNIAGVPRPRLALLHRDGTPDLTFKPELPPAGTIHAMAVQPDGKLLIGGSFTNVGPMPIKGIARLNPNGTLDTAFDPGAGPNGNVAAILVQPDCKILVAGSFIRFDNYLRGNIVRLNSDPPSPPVITRQPVSQSVTAGADVMLAVEASCVPPAMFQWFRNGEAISDGTNSLLLLNNVSAAADYRVVLSNALDVFSSMVATVSVNPAPTSPGTVDPGYAVGDGADSTIRVMARQSDGKLVVAGWFTQLHGVAAPGIARLNADGSVDTSFDAGSGPDHRIVSLSVDSNDRILVGGMFTNFNGHAHNRLVRLNPNGDIDTGFDIGTGFSGGNPPAVNALAVHADGKIIAAGVFGNFNNASRQNVVRLHPTGSLDTTFVTSFIPGDVLSVAIRSDGRVWLGLRTGLIRLETNGMQSLNFPTQVYGEVRALLIQPDGKLLIGGSVHIGPPPPAAPPLYGVGRINPDGTRDTNFYDQLLLAAPGVETLQLHACGRILVGGSFYPDWINRQAHHVARLEPNGTLDPAFGAKVLDGTVYDIEVEPSSEVVIAGQFGAVDHTVRNGLARLHAETLGPPAIFTQPVSQAVSGGDEVLLSVVVTNCADFTFQWQLNGTNLPGATNASLLLPSARVADGGEYRVAIRQGSYESVSEPAQLHVAREPRHPGSPDVEFFPPRTWDGAVQALALDGNGNVLAGGAFTRINGVAACRVARFNWRGNFDFGFRAPTNLSGTVYALAVQPDGKILAGGVFPGGSSTTNFVVRLLPNGQSDPAFVRTPQFGTGTATAVAALPDGKLLVGGMITATAFGAARTGMARLHADGTLDTNFNAGVRYPLCFTRQRDGRIIMGGTFTNVGNQPRAGLARIQPNGGVDMTFNAAEGANSPVMTVALARDEKAFIGGNFTQVAGHSRIGIARLNHDGSVDESFDPGLGVRSVWALTVQPDDKLLVGGSFTFAGGLARSGIARFNANGAIDPTFDPGSGADGQVFTLLCDPTGKIYLGGNFSEYNGLRRDRLARANGDLFLLNPRVIGGNFQVSLFTFYGQSYTLEFKTALTDTGWTQGPSLLGDGTIRTMSDPAASGLTRWYRVRSEP